MSWSSAVPWESIISNNNDTNGYTSRSTRRNVSQAGMDKIVYDILSSDKGLAELARGENLSGGYGSSTKTLMSQDLVAKLAGELATINAETTDVNINESNKRSALGGRLSVICTELHRQGLLSNHLYRASQRHFNTLSPRTINGYQAWGKIVVKGMQRSNALTRIWHYIALARIYHISGKRKSFAGWFSIAILENGSYCLGYVMELLENTHGRFANS